MYYNRKLEPIDQLEWAKMYESLEDRKIAVTYINEHEIPPTEGATAEEVEAANETLGVVDGRVFVSTVFLGLDHSFGNGGPPLVFETMVFGGPYDSRTERYSTEEQALAGHKEIVAMMRRGFKDKKDLGDDEDLSSG